MDILYQPLASQNNWVIIVLIFMLFLLFVIKKAFNQRFTSQLKLVNQNIWFPNLNKSYTLIVNFYNVLFLIIICFSLAFVLLIYIDNYSSFNIVNSFYLFFKISFYLGLFFIFKQFLNLFFSVVFRLNLLVHKLVFIKISYLNFLGLFIFIWLPFVLFSNDENLFIFKIFGIITLLLAVYFYYLIIKNNLKVISKHFFYFILYLCTLEIAPIILLYKVFILKFKM
jgi:Domain of unknown function (DUF4271)